MYEMEGPRLAGRDGAPIARRLGSCRPSTGLRHPSGSPVGRVSDGPQVAPRLYPSSVVWEFLLPPGRPAQELCRGNPVILWPSTGHVALIPRQPQVVHRPVHSRSVCPHTLSGPAGGAEDSQNSRREALGSGARLGQPQRRRGSLMSARQRDVLRAVVAREQARRRLRTTTAGIGFASVVAGGVIAFTLPGSTHTGSSATGSARSGGSAAGSSSRSGSTSTGSSSKESLKSSPAPAARSKSSSSGSGSTGSASTGSASTGSGSSGSSAAVSGGS